MHLIVKHILVCIRCAAKRWSIAQSSLEPINELCQKISFAVKNARDQPTSHDTHLRHSPVESSFVDEEIVMCTEYESPRLSEQLVDVPFEVGHGIGQLAFFLPNVGPNALKDALKLPFYVVRCVRISLLSSTHFRLDVPDLNL